MASAPSVPERCAGSLWGLAWGDVLGAPIESWTAAEIATAYGSYDALPTEYPAVVPEKKRARLRPLGIHTDDTQQSLALINVCLAGWSPAAWAQCLVAGDKAKSWRGTGKQFDGAVLKLAKGSTPQQSGSASAGIGAAMRAAPLGALYRDQSRKLVEVSLEASAVTHADLRAIALSYAVAWSSAQLINGTSVDSVRAGLPDAVAEAEDEWLHGKVTWGIERNGRHQMSLGIARALAVPMDLDALAALVVRYATPYMDKAHLPAHANHAFALAGGLFGLAAGLLTDVDDVVGDERGPGGVLLRIVRMGEDTDTVAAIAGGVLGARFGHAWVPKERMLQQKRIEPYALALVQRNGAPEPMPALLAREAELTAFEVAFQKDSAKSEAPGSVPSSGKSTQTEIPWPK